MLDTRHKESGIQHKRPQTKFSLIFTLKIQWPTEESFLLSLALFFQLILKKRTKKQLFDKSCFDRGISLAQPSNAPAQNSRRNNLSAVHGDL